MRQSFDPHHKQGEKRVRSHVHFVREKDVRNTTCGRLCERYVLDAWALGGVLFKGDSGSAAEVLVDEIQVERSEEAVV